MQKGHSLKDIGNYSLPQFLMILEALEETEARERMATVADLTSVVGSLFSSETISPVAQHIWDLLAVAAGVKNGAEQS